MKSKLGVEDIIHIIPCVGGLKMPLGIFSAQWLKKGVKDRPATVCKLSLSIMSKAQAEKTRKQTSTRGRSYKKTWGNLEQYTQ